MRVALLSHSARRGDAIGNQLALLVRFLTGHGWEVRLFVESLAELHADLARLAVAHTADSLWRSPADRGFLCDADLVLVEYGSAYDLLHVLPALRTARPRIIFHYHGVTPRHLWAPEDQHRLEGAERLRDLVWCADVAVVKSHFTAGELHAATNFPRDRIHVVPCCVDAQRFQPGPSVKDLRGQLRLGVAIVLLYVGRLAANKRVPLLVEALARLPDEPQPVHAVILGDASDIYQAQAELCRQSAVELGVSDRLHLLGAVSDQTILDWYRSADALVLPSLHEGFGLPIIEAMACGLPVIAARSTALPETLGDAGLSFHPDDAEDLARQVRRVMGDRNQESGIGNQEAGSRFRVAVVSPRCGTDFVGGAETSLRTIARSLHRLGHRVEVFTTCTRRESAWRNELPAGSGEADGIAVHRFPIDPHDHERHLADLDAIRRDGASAELEAAYLSSSLHSRALIDALGRRELEFDAIVVGPYLFGLTWRVAQRFGAKVLLLPCFHDEPFARFRSFQETYSKVGGLLYHTKAEQWFAEAELGINHPNGNVIGTLLEQRLEPQSSACPVEPPYSLVYCGRYSIEKGVDRLLEFAACYAGEHPGRFRFVFMGQGSLALPRAPWLVDRGFVSETEKQREIAQARALIQLSTNESLSLVALEAWAAGVPVIGHCDCRAVSEQIAKARGGLAVRDYADFAAALDSLWDEPERWRQMGQSGQQFVRAEYTSLEEFGRRLLDAVEGLSVPVREQMQRKGLARARRFDVPAWQARWLEVLTPLLKEPHRRKAFKLHLELSRDTRRVAPSVGSVLLPVKVHNLGAWPAFSTGPRPVLLECAILDERGRRVRGQRPVPLPSLLRPGATTVAVVPVPVPVNCGHYRVYIGAGMTRRARLRRALRSEPLGLVVTKSADDVGSQVAVPFLASAQRALAEANELKRLPDDYRDVTQGLLAKWKRAIKQKLLHQFRRSYVDVLSRQQSTFNEKLLVALCQLADGLAALGQAAASQAEPSQIRELRRLLRRALRENRRTRKQVRDLEERLAAIDSLLPE